MQKLYFLLAILLGCFLHSQINMKINLVGVEKTYNGPSYKIQVKIKNTSSDLLAIPFGLTKLKAYYEDDRCVNKQNFREINNLDITALVKSKGRLMEPFPNPFPQYAMEDLLVMQKQKKIADSTKQNTLKRWMYENRISNISFAEMSKTLLDNILLFNPKEEISYLLLFTPGRVDCVDCDVYFYYMLENDTELDFSLMHCVDDSIYSYLTERQKKKLKRYKLFSGELLSNEIKLHYSSIY